MRMEDTRISHDSARPERFAASPGRVYAHFCRRFRGTSRSPPFDAIPLSAGQSLKERHKETVAENRPSGAPGKRQG